jgi:hypothetical protein
MGILCADERGAWDAPTRPTCRRRHTPPRRASSRRRTISMAGSPPATM